MREYLRVVRDVAKVLLATVTDNILLLLGRRSADTYISKTWRFRGKTTFEGWGKQIVLVFQGPIVNDVTLETIETYRKIYPSVEIIYAMWAADNNKHGDHFRKLGVDVVIVQDPGADIDNQNRMITSVVAGLSRTIDRFGCDCFCVRMRGDQRACRLGWPFFLRSLWASFPATNWTGPGKFRIGASSHSSGKLRPFMLGDQFQFGLAEDLFSLWNVPMVEDGLPKLFQRYGFENGILDGFGIKADNYLLLNYLFELDDYQFSLTEGYRFFARKGLIVDNQCIELKWFRQNKSKISESVVDINPHYGSFRESEISGHLSFADWLLLNASDGEHYPWKGVTPETWRVKQWKCGCPIYEIVSLGGDF